MRAFRSLSPYLGILRGRGIFIQHIRIYFIYWMISSLRAITSLFSSNRSQYTPAASRVCKMNFGEQTSFSSKILPVKSHTCNFSIELKDGTGSCTDVTS